MKEFFKPFLAWTSEKHFLMVNGKWLLIITACLLSYVISKLVDLLLYFLKKLAKTTENKWDDLVLTKIRGPLVFISVILLWMSVVHLLDLPHKAHDGLIILIKILIYAGVIWGIYRVADVAGQIVSALAKKTGSPPLDDTLVSVFNKIIKVIIILMGGLFIIQNLGYNVMSIVAGLGLGGLAFALAAKDTCANLFGSINILVDKPFRVGDYIVLEGYEGDVEEIGLRSTRIRTFYDSQISVPNALLSNIRIDNMGRRHYRRIRTTLGIRYDTPPKKITEFIQKIKDLIQSYPHNRKDAFQVAVHEFGPYSLNILVNFFLVSDKSVDEFLEKEKIFLDILKIAKEVDVHFAFPTQSIFFEKNTSKQK